MAKRRKLVVSIFVQTILVVNLSQLVLCYVPLSDPIYQGKGKLVNVPKVRKFERNAYTEFEFLTLSSRVETAYSDFPNKSSFNWDMDGPDVLFGDACDVQLVIELIDYMQGPEDSTACLCLFKEDLTATNDLFTGNPKLTVRGKKYNPVLYYKKLQPVTGFVMGEFHSLVSGFLIKEFFYGSVRMYDPLPAHHIVFYIEPYRNLGLYNGHLVNATREPGRNAILFEYVRHEDGSFSEPSPPKADADYPTFADKALENVNADSPDVFEATKVKVGLSRSSIFDVRRNETYLCEACVWVQPNFAKKYGLGGGVAYGVGEIISILNFALHIYQGIDFNRDGLAEELRVVVKDFIVTDSVQVSEKEKKVKPGDVPPADGSGGAGGSPVSSTTLPRTARDVDAKSPSGLNDEKQEAKEAKEAAKEEEIEEMEEPFSPEIGTFSPKGAFNSLKGPLAALFSRKKCCVILAYVYHNLAPKFSVSSLAGACTKKHSLGIISGYLHDHKIAKYDVYRATMHALGHLFGAKKDTIADPRCKIDIQDTPNIFNSLLMDSFQKTDIGIRPNAMRYSPCAKVGISAFLSSANADCFRSGAKPKSYCGNGIIEKGEMCDCGLPWQCHLSEVKMAACCGESDTFLGCKKLGNKRFQRTVLCHRPWEW